jgi:hypothetical protein
MYQKIYSKVKLPQINRMDNFYSQAKSGFADKNPDIAILLLITIANASSRLNGWTAKCPDVRNFVPSPLKAFKIALCRSHTLEEKAGGACQRPSL